MKEILELMALAPLGGAESKQKWIITGLPFAYGGNALRQSLGVCHYFISYFI